MGDVPRGGEIQKDQTMNMTRKELEAEIAYLRRQLDALVNENCSECAWEKDSRDSNPCNYCVRNTELFCDNYTHYTEANYEHDAR